MRPLLIAAIVIICFVNSVKAKNYYFSSSSGKDSRSSTEVQNPSTPWKSINKLNSVFALLEPGDTVFFKRGDSFFGTIRPTKSGTAKQPIVFSAYSTGDQPIITSLVKLSGWVSVGNGIWESYNSKLGSDISLLLINGSMREMGRFPNSDAANKGYLTIDAFTSNTSITDSELKATPDWTGAEVVIRRNRWNIDRNIIKSHAGQTIHYASASSSVAKAGFGYFIQNHIKTLDQEGEWSYNPSTKTISVYFGLSSPVSHVVEAPVEDNLIYAVDCSFINFHGITFKGGNKDTFKVKGGNDITINNCKIQYSGRNGIKLTKHTNFLIENSTIQHSNSTGINIAASNFYPIIKNNKILNTGLLPGMGEIDGTLSIGIQCYSEGATIEYNEVQNSGYNGIAIKLKSVKVRNNFINNYCITKDDGGGIYSANGSNKTFSDAEITGNIILNGIGAPQGTSSLNSNAEGIYMDDNSNGVEIKNNTVANCNRGIYLHNARNMSITNNSFFNNAVQLYAKHDKTGDPIRNIAFNKNILFAKLPTQSIAHFESNTDDIESFGSFDYNYSTRPLDDRIVYSYSYKDNAGKKQKGFLDLEGWKRKFGKEIHSKRAPLQINPYTLNSYIGSNKFTSGTFGISANKNEVFGNRCTLTWLDEGLLDGGYLSIEPTEAGSSVTISIGNLDPKKNYILKYSAISEGDMTIGTYLRYGGSPYRPITPVIYRKISTGRSDNEILFTPSIKQGSGTLVFTADQAENYCLDNIQLYEADALVTEPDDYIRFEYNSTKDNKIIVLEGEYRDVEDKLYSDKIVIPPYSSIILIKDTENVVKRHSGLTTSQASEIRGVVKDVEVQEHLDAYPNPFTSTVTIRYALAAEEKYSLTLYDSKGVKLESLKRGRAATGKIYTIKFNGSKLATGIYFVRLETAKGVKTTRILLDK